MIVKPYLHDSAGKKTQVEDMFNAIAPTYDLLNRLLSFGCDIIWRRKLARKVAKQNPATLLDLATGTGDVALEIARQTSAQITGADIARQMLDRGVVKAKSAGLDNRIHFVQSDAENLVFDDNTFDALTVSFGVRNYENLQKGLKEMNRVLKPGGHCYVLEFSMPVHFPIKQIYHFYFKRILPLIGRLIARDQSAYMYLFKSVEAFPKGDAFVKEMYAAGFKTVNQNPLTWGVVCLYTAVK